MNKIQQAMHKKANMALGEVEYQIDLFIDNNYNSSFSMLKYLKQLDYKKKIIEIMRVNYVDMLAELNDDDEQVIEAYDYMTTAQMNKFKKFVQSIIDGCDKYIVTKQPEWDKDSQIRRVQNKIKKRNKERIAEIEKKYNMKVT